MDRKRFILRYEIVGGELFVPFLSGLLSLMLGRPCAEAASPIHLYPSLSFDAHSAKLSHTAPSLVKLSKPWCMYCYVISNHQFYMFLETGRLTDAGVNGEASGATSNRFAAMRTSPALNYLARCMVSDPPILMFDALLLLISPC